MNTEPTRSTAWYLDHLAADTERLATLLDTGPTDAPVAACPGWDVRRLAEHVGQIHRWANFCATNARPPSADEAAALESFDADRAADWLRDGSATLAATLRDLDPAADTWHPFPVERVGAVWPRRLAHEIALHRWDAERAAGVDAEIDPELASDGIDEYFELVVPRLVKRDGVDLPGGSLHVHCTDVDGEWLVWSDDGDYRMIRAHQKGDAALRGPALPILLRLWGRDSGRGHELSPVGDEDVLANWLALSGM
jgi:uncharacterized protein (TIGR03083 family)